MQREISSASWGFMVLHERASELTIACDYQTENVRVLFLGLLPTSTALVEIGEGFRRKYGRNANDLRDDQA